jgi:hypothetical protein
MMRLIRRALNYTLAKTFPSESPLPSGTRGEHMDVLGFEERGEGAGRRVRVRAKSDISV